MLFERPNIKLPVGINAVTTTRLGGISKGGFNSLNLGEHVGDDLNRVKVNRSRLRRSLNLPAEPCWLRQVHSDRIANSGEADGSYSCCRGEVLCIQSADCLPILIWNESGKEIGAVHGGWRGLAKGIIARVVQCFDNSQLSAWIGPHIKACHYEIDQKLYEIFSHFPGVLTEGSDDGHWQMSLAEVARQQLVEAGVGEIFESGSCSACDENRFFSFRRDGSCGRMATLIWMS